MLFALALVCTAAPGASVELVFTGDAIPHDSVKRAARAHDRRAPDGGSLNHQGWDDVFGPLAETFRRADLAVVNLETPLTVSKQPRRGELVFWAPPAMAQALAAAGVSVATFANNHSQDQSFAGIVETRRHLREAGLLTAGAGANAAQAWQPACVLKNGLKLCFLAFTRFYCSTPLI